LTDAKLGNENLAGKCVKAKSHRQDSTRTGTGSAIQPMTSDSSSSSPLAISSRSSCDDKFVVVKGIAGLGNRILCALGGILYARLTARTLVVDWSDPIYSSSGDNVFHRFFSSASCPRSNEIPTTGSVCPVIWRGRLHESAPQIAKQFTYNPDDIRRELSIDLSRLDYQEHVAVIVQYDASMERLRPHFQGPFQDLAKMPDRAILAMLLRQDLTLHPEIRERVDQFKRSHFGPRIVGVHIRYSDYRVRILAIIRQLNALLKRERQLQVFLATDNSEIKKMFESNYSGVITTPHWYADPGRSIHRNPKSPDSTETAIEALLDLYLLAECSHLIIDESSSFSALASLLSLAPASNKINVATRDKGNRRVRGTITRLLRRVRFHSWAFRLLPRLLPIRRL